MTEIHCPLGLHIVSTCSRHGLLHRTPRYSIHMVDIDYALGLHITSAYGNYRLSHRNPHYPIHVVYTRDCRCPPRPVLLAAAVVHPNGIAGCIWYHFACHRSRGSTGSIGSALYILPLQPAPFFTLMLRDGGSRTHNLGLLTLHPRSGGHGPHQRTPRGWAPLP